MKFVPKSVREVLLCLAWSTVVFTGDDLRETMEWLGVSIESARHTQRVNFEMKLRNKKLIRKSDWRKIDKLFCGFESEDLRKMGEDVAMKVMEGKVTSWQKRVMESKRQLKFYDESISSKFSRYPNILYELRRIRFWAVRHQWLFTKEEYARKFGWMCSSGGVKLGNGHIQNYSDDAKDDEYLIETFGGNTSEPLMYGATS